MDTCSWSWSPLNLKKVVKRPYGELLYVEFPDGDLLSESYPKMRQDLFPVTVMIRSDEMASIYANDKLFPYYEGSMLKEKRKTVKLTGKYREIEAPKKKGQPSKWYMEFTLVGSGKKIKLSKKGYGEIFSLVEGEIEKLANMEVVVYGEYGRWFRTKEQPGVWALWVDLEATAKLNGLEVPK